MSKSQREKGKRGEREAAAEIRRLLGTNARRSAQYCGKAGDSDLIDAIPGFHVEVKNVKRIGALKYHDQAAADAKGSRPVVVMKADRTKFYALLTLEDFASLFPTQETPCSAS